MAGRSNKGRRETRRGARTLAALGIVFGDIGTSPLYAIGLLFAHRGSAPAPDEVLGAISLAIWVLTLVVGLKYALLVLRADNDGEGGVFALYALLGALTRRPGAPLGWALLLGAGMLFGDGIVTPAISVLAAVEGVALAAPAFAGAVMPVTLVILILLFLLQHRGTRVVGGLFGPVMLAWFAALAGLGLDAILARPDILAALSPAHGARLLLAADPAAALVVIGTAILVVTGAEAMYADVGQVGAAPIRRAWFALVYPALLLNYLGQGAHLLDHPAAAGPGLLFQLVPAAWLPGFVGLATLATIIASQALISGTFSLVAQAIALGLLPRLEIAHTNRHHRHEVYLPAINWLLFAGCVLLVLSFGSSAELGAAYGFAVAGNMLTTSIAMIFVAHRLWAWSARRAAAIFGSLALLDAQFLVAASTKMADGGYIPLAIGLACFAIMRLWSWGRARVHLALGSRPAQSVADLRAVHRDAARRDGPPAVLVLPGDDGARRTRLAGAMLARIAARQGALPRQLLLVHVAHLPTPFARDRARAPARPGHQASGTVAEAELRFGFMDPMDMDAALDRLGTPLDCVVHVMRERPVPKPGARPIIRASVRAYALLHRLSRPIDLYYRIGARRPLCVETLVIELD